MAQDTSRKSTRRKLKDLGEYEIARRIDKLKAELKRREEDAKYKSYQYFDKLIESFNIFKGQYITVLSPHPTVNENNFRFSFFKMERSITRDNISHPNIILGYGSVLKIPEITYTIGLYSDNVTFYKQESYNEFNNTGPHKTLRNIYILTEEEFNKFKDIDKALENYRYLTDKTPDLIINHG